MNIDVDFSLALNDRTGKLFLGKDIIAALGERISDIRYGRLRSFPSNDLLRRVAGRLTHTETVWRTNRNRLAAVLPLIRSANPTLHLDPLSVVRHRLEARDIVLCHDVGPITHPQYFAPGVDQLYAVAYDQIRSSRPHMVFVSETSRQAFHAIYGHEFASSTALYIPTRHGVQEGEICRPAGIESPFLLTVGSIGDRKNQARSIRAFAASGLAEKGWRYVVVGGREPGAEEVIRVASETPGVVRPGYSSDSELRWLYRNASGFVLMSLLEGFGMPIIEAIEHDLPCLVSKSGVLTEIGGAATLQADPQDITSIARGMQTLAGMPRDERAQRMSSARAHIRKFERGPILDGWRALIDSITPMRAKDIAGQLRGAYQE